MFSTIYEYIFGCTHDYKIIFSIVKENDNDNHYIQTICNKCGKIRCRTLIPKKQYDYNVNKNF